VIIVAALIASDWRRRVTSSTTTGERGSESNNVAIGNTDADERMTTSAQDDMPLVWPTLLKTAGTLTF
jgi:hypothetical protein